jgi:hypothetical protein
MVSIFPRLLPACRRTLAANLGQLSARQILSAGQPAPLSKFNRRWHFLFHREEPTARHEFLSSPIREPPSHPLQNAFGNTQGPIAPSGDNSAILQDQDARLILKEPPYFVWTQFPGFADFSHGIEAFSN